MAKSRKRPKLGGLRREMRTLIEDLTVIVKEKADQSGPLNEKQLKTAKAILAGLKLALNKLPKPCIQAFSAY